MTRIQVGSQTKVDDQWVNQNQEEIKTHPAWAGGIGKEVAEDLLKGKAPYTYVLRGEALHEYFIGYVKEDGSIKHQRFVLEVDRKGWHYRNGTTDGPMEILAKDLSELIPMMMHCDPADCTPCEGMI